MDKEIGKTGEYIYLVQERESIRCKDNIYKIGKTKQKPMKRVSAYPTGSKLWITIIVNDATLAEKDLLKIFRNKFKQITEIGAEYFFGNPVEMIKEIVDYQSKHFNIETDDVASNYVDSPDVKDNEDNMVNGSDECSSDISDEGQSQDKLVNMPEKNDYDYDDDMIKHDVETVMESIKKPMQLSKYTKALADTVKNLGLSNKHSANIHVDFDPESNIFNVNSIDIISPNKKMIQQIHFENINVDVDENKFKIELNPYHFGKFNKVKINGVTSYVINICSFEIKKYRFIYFYKTVILPDLDRK